MQLVVISTYEIRLIFLEPMLEDNSQFNLSNDEGTHLQSRASQLATIPTILSVFLNGVLLDLVGRRIMISITLFLMGLLLAHIPFAYPSVELLYVDLVVSYIFL